MVHKHLNNCLTRPFPKTIKKLPNNESHQHQFCIGQKVKINN